MAYDDGKRNVTVYFSDGEEIEYENVEYTMLELWVWIHNGDKQDWWKAELIDHVYVEKGAPCTEHKAHDHGSASGSNESTR